MEHGMIISSEMLLPLFLQEMKLESLSNFGGRFRIAFG